MGPEVLLLIGVGILVVSIAVAAVLAPAPPAARQPEVAGIPGGSDVSASYVVMPDNKKYVVVVYRSYGVASCPATGTHTPLFPLTCVSVPGGSSVTSSTIRMPDGDHYLVTVYRSYGVSVTPLG